MLHSAGALLDAKSVIWPTQFLEHDCTFHTIHVPSQAEQIHVIRDNDSVIGFYTIIICILTQIIQRCICGM